MVGGAGTPRRSSPVNAPRRVKTDRQILRELRHPNAGIRGQAAMDLCSARPDVAREALPIVVKIIGDPDESPATRGFAEIALPQLRRRASS